MAFRFQPPENPQVTDDEPESNSFQSNEGESSQEGQKTASSRMTRMLADIRATRAGRLTMQIGIAVLGAVIIGIGIILLPLPGPGWLIIFAGMAIWSIEFHWARRLRRFTQRQVRAWTSWYATQGWLLRIVVGLATMLVILAIVYLSLRISLGPDFISRIISIF